jgi:thiol:disulfide interchange protein DsbD
LVALGPAIAPGGAQMVGLILTMEEHWHVYWINAGDSGEPPHIAWTLPAGIAAGPMQFPIPDRLPLGPLMDFGYEDEVAFPVRISAAPTVRPGPAHLDAQVTWLVCAQVCIPGKAHLGLDLTVQPGALLPEQEPKLGALGEALTLIPGPLPTGAKFSVTGGTQGFKLTLIDGKRESDAEFYPLPAGGGSGEATDVMANAADQMIESRPDGIDLDVQRSPDLASLPATLHGVFKLSDTVAYEVFAPVTGNPATADGSDPASTAKAGGTATVAATAAQFGLAFLGGIILNLMPCVFPVLFLKGLSLVQSSGQQRATVRRHGLVYAAGVVASFWAIVAVLLALRATGSQIGWGFHLQSPVFVAVLASFMFFFALSLAGQFDIGLSLTSVGSSLVDGPDAKEHGYAGSFFTGVLATVVATPCAAPLMGAAVGFALAQSAGIAFAIFTALALGLAAPYVLLSWHPAWVRLLPKPGAWMEVLKQVTAVPLFATAIWLAWVYGQLRGGDGVDQLALLLAGFLVLAIAGWVLGRWPAQWPGRIAAAVLIPLALAIPFSQKHSANEQRTTDNEHRAPSTAQPASSPVWQPYSQQALDAALAGGHPVFIDFTAAWCISCQFNERAVLKSSEVEAALLKGNVVTLKADWTNADPAITAKLASIGRAGVPTYVLYSAAASSAPDVLPELLTKALVLAAIQRDTN